MEACVRLPVIHPTPWFLSSGLSAPAGAKKPRRGVDEGCGFLAPAGALKPERRPEGFLGKSAR